MKRANISENTIQNLYGSISLESKVEFIAGSFSTIILTYTAGKYGMDDLGGLKIFFRFACDQSPLQMEDPKGLGYTTATASNGANVFLSYSSREGKRPWYKMLRVRIAGKGLKEGESIRIKIGNKEYGSLGIRLQTFCEPSFEFLTHADVFSTNVFIPLKSPKISIVSGPVERWKAIIPTLGIVGEKFDLKIRAEDKWGNPSDKADCKLIFKPSHLIKGLPHLYKVNKGQLSHIIKGLEIQNLQPVHTFKDLIVSIVIYDSNSNFLTKTNPLMIKIESPFKHFWGDIHGQSEETIGTNTAESYFKFGRDIAYLDVIGHQANGFQVTKQLWEHFNYLSEKYYEPHKFVTLFGYEYSANTALGGDRNVYFLKPHQQIYRSSHALIQGENDQESDCISVSKLFYALHEHNPNATETVLVIPHVGGRYADIRNYHDETLEHSIEIHSEWGTFEWLLFDAFEMGYRMGIVASSDDHKGRPGVAYPGASKFGTYGGLTCFLSSELTRENIFQSLKHRHHYATTGERIFLELNGKLNHDCIYYEKDPSIHPTLKRKKNFAQMGDIFGIPNDLEVIFTLSAVIASSSPIERLELFNGTQLIATIRPYLYSSQELENVPIEVTLNDHKVKLEPNLGFPIEKLSQIRVRWEGAEFRARMRNSSWKGYAEFENNKIIKYRSFNFWNEDAPLLYKQENKLLWDTYTSGNIQGFDVQLLDPFNGNLIFQTSQINFKIPISSIGIEDTLFVIGGVGKQVQVYRYPPYNPQNSFNFIIDIPLKPEASKDESIFVKVTLENGHQAWSSPIYFIKENPSTKSKMQ
jgi:hypothetical protein